MRPNITIFAAIDGLRAPALDETACPNLHALCQTSAYTLHAASVMPSITLPCFMSMFHSVPPARHGTMNNVYVPNTRPVPGLIEQAHAQGKKCAFFHNWEPLRDLNTPLNLTFSYFIDNLYDGPDADRIIVEQALAHMPQAEWDFVFIYMGSLDMMGHAHGFMSPQYREHITRLDALVGELIERLPPEATLMLTSDHGGHARTHGTDSPDDMVIPWWLRGPGIRRGYEVTTPVSLLDVAPTLAKLLGVPSHPDWEGHCIEEAFIREVS